MPSQSPEPGHTPLEPSKVLHSERLRGGQMWSRVVKRGQVLRVTNTKGGATPAMLLYNPSLPLERYNMADTLKGQHVARLTKGNCLYSDMGRIFFSIIEDSFGWHDTITGHMTRTASEKKFGSGTYHALRNSFHRNTRDNLLIELGKYGLGKKDLVPNINLFTKVAPDDEGRLSWQGAGAAADYVDLRAEMPTLVVLSNTPHPLDPTTEYAPPPVDLALWAADPVASDDYCRTHRPENERAFILTENYQI